MASEDHGEGIVGPQPEKATGSPPTPVLERWTNVRLAALDLVARGQLDYSLSTGAWEPREGHRRLAFSWLEERGYIEPRYEDVPVGRVMRLVPVILTPKGRQVHNDRYSGDFAGVWPT